MTSYEHPGYLQDGFLTHDPLSMGLSARSGVPTSLATTMSFQPDQSNFYCTPRSIAPQPDYIPVFSSHDYQHGGAYTISSNSTSARGRSGSGGSSVSASYSVASPRMISTSPYPVNRSGSQYQGTYDGDIDETELHTLRSPGASLPVLPHRVKQGPVSAAPKINGSRSSSNNVDTDAQICCQHLDCQDEEGKPKKFFSRKADVTRHHKSRHDVTYIDCPKRNCERKGSDGFTRQDHLTEHLRGFHMESIAKRQMANAKGKRGEKQTNEDSNDSNGSEDLTPTNSTVHVPASRSRGSSFVDHAGQRLKQELRSPSDEVVDDGFTLADTYPSTSANRGKTTTNNRVTKAKTVQAHPYQRRQSKSQPQRPSPPQRYLSEDKNQHMLQQITISPEYATSRMMPQSPVYATQVAMVNTYTNDHMHSPVYATHQGVDSFFNASSMASGYNGLHVQATNRYSMDGMNGFDFPHMHE